MGVVKTVNSIKDLLCPKKAWRMDYGILQRAMPKSICD